MINTKAVARRRVELGAFHVFWPAHIVEFHYPEATPFYLFARLATRRDGVPQWQLRTALGEVVEAEQRP